MAKRIRKKAGDIFILNLPNNTIRYFQFIKTDTEYLSGDIIRIFNSSEELISDFSNLYNIGVWRYFRTYISDGLQEDLMERVGNMSIENNIQIPPFKQKNDDFESDCKWIIDFNGTWKYFKELPEEYHSLPIGDIILPKFLVKIVLAGYYKNDPYDFPH